MKDFDPNSAAGQNLGIFGLPFSRKESQLVILPVPWEATTSYGAGTAEGPQHVLEASYQVDLFDFHVSMPYEAGIFMGKESSKVRAWNREAKKLATPIIKVGGEIGSNKKLQTNLKKVNQLSHQVNEYVYQEAKQILQDKKIVAVLGGDHAVPLGAFRAAGEALGKFGILHFDAHSDTRNAYEGFTYSHASIMRNALEEIPKIEKLVQVGIRDFCEEEFNYVQSKGDRVKVFYDEDLFFRKSTGHSWSQIAKNIVKELPNHVWVSFDIDGLNPQYCPNTGTPVPGGLEFQEATMILLEIVRSGKKIIGFDLVEVAPDPTNQSEWNGNVGARLLYKLIGFTLASQGKSKLRN